MTAFNAIYDRHGVLIVMDTLATVGAGEDPSAPLFFTSKMYPVLHLKGVICGTGIGPFIQEWAQYVNTGMLARDFVHLDEFTPNGLRRLASNEKYASSAQTSTVYHFGYFEEEDVYRGYAYRSLNNFNSEPYMDYGTFILKPATDFTFAEIKDQPTALIELAKVVIQQKAEQDALPVEDRVFIGGEIQYAVLERGNIQMGTCARFPDYDEVYDRMCDILPANNATE